MNTRGRSLFTIALAVFASRAGAEEPRHFAADRPLDCLHIKLDLSVDLENKHVAGTARIDLAALRDVSTITFDAVDLLTDGVWVERSGQPATPAEYSNDGERITIALADPLGSGEHATVTIEYAVDNPTSGLHFFGPSANEPDIPYVVWSQGESITNRYWFPCFDNPNERQTTELVVTTKRKYQVSSNGRLVSKDEDVSADTVTYHWLQDKPHAAYLVSLIVGEFHVERHTWRGRPVTYWANPRYKEWMGRTFQNTIPMLDFFSDKIGIEYPWDRYAQVSCEGFGGGMENTSVTTLGNWALHDERSFLDSNSDSLIAHELAHQWWGDLLTCREWAHLWLNEGFASYFEALWAEHDLGSDEFRYNMYRKANRARRGGKKKPIIDRAYEKPGDNFDARAYPKGAWVLHMLRGRLGDDLFWKAINKYGTDNAFKTVETVDLRKAIEQVSGRSFERFFYDWTERPGHPEVTVSYKWLNEDKLAKVSIKQTQDAAAFHFPLTIEFRFDSDRPATTVTCDVTEKTETVYYPMPRAPDMVRVDPGQTVLMDLKEKKGRGLWKAQLLDDANPVARIRAAKHFGDAKSDSDRKLLAGALQSETFWAVKREIAGALSEAGGDISRDALIAGLKFDNHKARRACVENLSSFHQDAVAIEAVRPLVAHGDPSYHVEGAAIETYAALEPADAIKVLKSALGRDSRFETIRGAVLSGLGKLRDPAVVPMLIEWSKPNKSRYCRPSAIRALASITKQTHVGDGAIADIVQALTECLNDSGRRVRGAAIRALGGLSVPDKARPALAKLKTIAKNDANWRVRKSVERAIKTIESGEPAQVQLADLREDLKEAIKKNEGLADRVEKLESQLSTRQRDGEDSDKDAT